MKKISIFLVIVFFLFGATLPAMSEENDQNFLGINPEDVIQEVVKVSPSETKMWMGQLGYDLTECDTPFDLPSLHTWNCACTRANLYIDTTVFSTAITVTPYWGFHDGTNLYPVEGNPTQLDPGYHWAISVQILDLSGVTGTNWYYAAGAVYQGQWYWNPVAYTFDVNCGGGGTENYAVIAGAGYTCAYSDNDAYALRDALVSQGWNPNNIMMLVSNASGTIHDCTKSNIQNAIASMASVADEDDVCLFFYSGHGGYQADAAPIDEDDPYDEYICPEGGNILDDELETWMSAISGNKLVAVDSCFSGGFIKQDGFVSRCSPGLPRVEITDGFGRDLDKPGFNVHTASDENESAYGDSSLQMGVFTYYLAYGLYGPADADFDGDVDTQEAHNYLHPLCVSHTSGWPTMHPQFYLGTASPLIWVK